MDKPVYRKKNNRKENSRKRNNACTLHYASYMSFHDCFGINKDVLMNRSEDKICKPK